MGWNFFRKMKIGRKIGKFGDMLPTNLKNQFKDLQNVIKHTSALNRKDLTKQLKNFKASLSVDQLKSFKQIETQLLETTFLKKPIKLAGKQTITKDKLLDTLKLSFKQDKMFKNGKSIEVYLSANPKHFSKLTKYLKKGLILSGAAGIAYAGYTAFDQIHEVAQNNAGCFKHWIDENGEQQKCKIVSFSCCSTHLSNETNFKACDETTIQIKPCPQGTFTTTDEIDCCNNQCVDEVLSTNLNDDKTWFECEEYSFSEALVETLNKVGKDLSDFFTSPFKNLFSLFIVCLAVFITSFLGLKIITKYIQMPSYLPLLISFVTSGLVFFYMI